MQLFVLTALTMTAFAANSVLNRLALKGHEIGELEFAAIRLAAGALMLLLLALVMRRGLGSLTWLRLTGAASLLVYMLGFSHAYLALDAGVGALILFGGVQLTMFAGALLTGEGLPTRRWIGAFLAFSGLIWLLWPKGGTNAAPLGPSLSMAAAAMGWGIYSLNGRRGGDPLAGTAANFLLAAPIAAVLAFSMASPAEAATRYGVALAITSGAITSGLGYALWYAILPKLGSARAAVSQLTVPVIAAAGGVFLIGETPSLTFVMATVLVLGGVAVASR